MLRKLGKIARTQAQGMTERQAGLTILCAIFLFFSGVAAYPLLA